MAVLTGTDEAKRFGVLALPYEKRALSISKEIMVDYDDNGHIYVKSKDGKKIFAVTKNLEILIQNILNQGGNDIHVDDPTDSGEDGILNEVLKHIYDYINACVQGLSIKDPARVLSDLDIPNLIGIPTEIDGVADLKDGDTILLIGQTDKKLNGKWIIHNDDWERSKDLDENIEISKSPFFFISEGDKYKETGWVLSTDKPIIGESELEWTIFTRQEDLLAGYGIKKEGNEISLKKVTTAGEAFKVKWDEYGNIISGENPTTLDGYNITDATPLEHVGSGGDSHAIVTEDRSGFSSPEDKKIIDSIFPALEDTELELNNKVDTKAEVEFIDGSAPFIFNLENGYPIADDLNTDSAEMSLSARQGKVIKDLLDTLFTNTNENGNPYMKLWMGTINQYHSLQEKDTNTTLYIATDTINENTTVSLDSSLEDLVAYLRYMQAHKVDRHGDQIYGPLIVGSIAQKQKFKVYGDMFINGVKIDELFAPIDHEHEDMVTIDKLNKELNNKANKNHTHNIESVTGLKQELNTKSDALHIHDDRYYSKEEIDFKLSTKAAAHHKHKVEDIEDLQNIIDPSLISKNLKDMIQDPSHRLVTEADIIRWNNMSNSGGSGDASKLDIIAHNTDPSAHYDIRELINDINSELGAEDLTSGDPIKETVNDILKLLPKLEATSLIHLENKVVNITITQKSTTRIPMNFPDYDKDIHTLMIFKNSVNRIEDRDFDINGGYIDLKVPVYKDDVISLIYLWIEYDDPKGNSVILNKFINTVKLEEDKDIISTGFDKFDKNIHTMIIFRNSVYQIENVDYTINSDNSIIPINKGLVNDEFTFIILWATGEIKTIQVNDIIPSIDEIYGLREILDNKSDINHTHKLADLEDDKDHRTVSDEQIKRWDSKAEGGSGGSSSNGDLEEHNISPISHEDIRELIDDVKNTITNIGINFEVIDFEATSDGQKEFNINKSDISESKYIHFVVIDGMVTNDYLLDDYKLKLNEGMSKKSSGHLYLMKIDGNTTILKELKLNQLSTELQTIINNKASLTDVYTKSEIDNMLSNISGGGNTYTKSEIDDKLDNIMDGYSPAQIINKIDNKADRSDVYTKNEVDSKLDDKANSSDVYTKTEIDNNLDDKANSSDVYTKTEIDNKLSDLGGGNISSSEVYTKSEVDSKLDNKVTKISGKGLSTNDFTNSYKNKLNNMKTIEVVTQDEYNALSSSEKSDTSKIYAIY